MYHSFTDMPVWKLALEMATAVFNITLELPRSEDSGLTSQIRRSSNSCSANIAEGFGRKTQKDKSHYYIMARGSAFETQSHLKYGNKIGYFDDQVTEKLFRQYADFIFEINKLISSLR